MHLYLIGHDRRYAAEQTLLTLFPDERPEYPEGAPEGERCELRLSRGAQYVTSSCRLVTDAGEYRARAAARIPPELDVVESARRESRVVKLAFFRAALKSGVPQPEWGSLTGVRPVKLMARLLDAGLSPRSAAADFRREYSVSAPRAKLCLDSALASEGAQRSLDARDVCLYVGIPFCPTRCAYCSFVSQSVEKSMALIEPYLAALLCEVEATGEAVKNAGLRPVSLYMGGGTPTTLSALQLDVLCSRLEECFDLSALREFTVEAGRPDTITREKLLVLRAHGVDRVSVNPQSMSDEVLDAIGRRHTAADIVSALSDVRSVGGFAVNMDLIAGLPADSEGGFRRTLETVTALAPENITVHTLAMKRGSRLNLERGALPCPDEVGGMLTFAMDTLLAGGWRPYYLYRQKFMSGGFENVGWTKPGYENLYNICIMEELCSIIAMGAGGSTKLAGGRGRIVRDVAPKYPREYIDDAEAICAGKKRIEEFYNGV